MKKVTKKTLCLVLSSVLILNLSHSVSAVSVTNSFHGNSVTAKLNRYTTYASGSTISGISSSFFSVDVYLEYYNDYGTYVVSHSTKNGTGGFSNVSVNASGTGTNVHTTHSTSDHVITSSVYGDSWTMHLVE